MKVKTRKNKTVIDDGNINPQCTLIELSISDDILQECYSYNSVDAPTELKLAVLNMMADEFDKLVLSDMPDYVDKLNLQQKLNDVEVGYVNKPLPTSKYKNCNHHHELTDQHEIVDFGDGEFVANKEAIPLLKSLNELGLRTRTHHITNEDDHAFISILLDNVEIEVKTVDEIHADRTKYNGKTELLIRWNK